MDTLWKNKVTKVLLFVVAVALIIFAFSYTNNSNKSEQVAATSQSQNDMEQDLPKISTTNPVVTLKTSKGDLTLELYMDRTVRIGNFIPYVPLTEQSILWKPKDTNL